MGEIRKVSFPEKDHPLRRDVSMLGQLLGETLVEQHGPELLDSVEAVRRAAILMREGDEAGTAALERALQGLDVDELSLILKAFSTYLRLTNLAEKVHRIRRRRAYLKKGDTAQRGSLEDVMGSFFRSGVDRSRLDELLATLRVRPVFTAHPTEATRRSLLEKEYSIIHRLVERLNPDLTPDEDARLLDRIRDAVNSAWQTSNVPTVKPTVADELDNVLFYMVEILYRVAPAFYEALEAAYEKAFGSALPAENRMLLKLGSWVGGDMDGNPNVNAKTLLDTLRTQRIAVIGRYRSEVGKLARYLSQTRGKAGFSPELENRLAVLAVELPGVMDSIPARHHDMPYRCFLKHIDCLLEGTVRGSGSAYAAPERFGADISLIADSLEQHKGRHAGLFGVQRLKRKIDTFGFHLATLDARQDALLHRRVLAELVGDPGWTERSREHRTQALDRWLAEGTLPETGDPANWSPETASTLEVFRAIARAKGQFGSDSIGLFIISMTQGADDVLTALALNRIANGADAVTPDIAPLLETVDDLESGPSILDRLLSLGSYRSHLERSGNAQVIMIGYSDSNKDSGIVSARWSLYEAQAKLVETGARHGTTIYFFHGRGGTVSRGGGNLVKGIEGAPPGTVSGLIRVTEQGETINQKYGIRPIALRSLELMAGAALRHDMLDTGSPASPHYAGVMNDIAARSREVYHELVRGHPAFIPYFRSATPIDVIERLAIGSRPASRRGGEGIENLRAIPWVFSWAQVRLGFPGAFGAGTALSEAIARLGIETMRAMHADWLFFQGLLSDIEMVLAKSVLDIGARYAELAAEDHRMVYGAIRSELELAERCVLQIKQIDELLDGERTLQRNIRLRNPYADPMHIMQIELLKRWRAGNRENGQELSALKSTVHGIALAIQNTG